MPLDARISNSPALLWRSQGKAVAGILVIPGNPGVCTYYEEYLETLHIALDRQYTILCASLLGHQAPGGDPSGSSRAFGCKRRFFTVKEQIDAQVHALDRIEAMHEERVPVILIGHSFGAYVAQRIFAKHGHRIDSVHYLFPTLANIAMQSRARRIAPLITPHGAVLCMWLAHVLAFLPFFVVLALVMLVTGMHGRTAAVSATFVRSPQAVFNSLSLARDEMHTIKNYSADTLRATASAPARNQTVRAFWAPSWADSWAPASARTHAEEQLHLERVPNDPTKLPFRSSTICRGTSHAFIAHASEHMAHITAAYIRNDIAARNARLVDQVVA